MPLPCAPVISSGALYRVFASVIVPAVAPASLPIPSMEMFPPVTLMFPPSAKAAWPRPLIAISIPAGTSREPLVACSAIPLVVCRVMGPFGEGSRVSSVTLPPLARTASAAPVLMVVLLTTVVSPLLPVTVVVNVPGPTTVWACTAREAASCASTTVSAAGSNRIRAFIGVILTGQYFDCAQQMPSRQPSFYVARGSKITSLVYLLHKCSDCFNELQGWTMVGMSVGWKAGGLIAIARRRIIGART